MEIRKEKGALQPVLCSLQTVSHIDWERGITYQKMSDIGKASADFQKARDLGYGN